MNGLMIPRLRLMPRRAGVESVYHSGLSPVIDICYGSIFLFHHVVPDVSVPLNGDLYVSATSRAHG